MLNNILKFFISDIVAKAMSVIFIPFFAYYLGPKELGIFAEWFSAYNILVAFLALGIPSYILILLTSSPDALKQDSINKVSTFFIKWVSVTIPLITLMFIFIGEFWYGASLLIVALSFTVIQFYASILRFNNNIKIYFNIQIFSTISTSLIPLLFVIVYASWIARAIGTTLSILVLSLFVVYIMLKKFKFSEYDSEFRRKLLRFGFPILLLVVVSWLKLFVDIQLLKNITDYESSGILFFSFQVVSIVSILAASLNRSSTPAFFKLLSENKLKLFLILILKLTLILLIISILVIFAVEVIIKYKLTEFIDSLQLLYPMLFGLLFYGLGQFISSIFLYFNKTHINAICVTLSSVLHPILSYYIIENFSWFNIGYSYLISNIFFFLLVVLFASRLNSYIRINKNI